MTTVWPLKKLLAENRNALTVFGTLRWLAGDALQLSPTRAKISDVCGLAEDTISEAMTTLGKAGWVAVQYGRDGARTWYRLAFPVADFFPVPAKRRHREAAATGKKAAQGIVRCTGKKAVHPRTGIGTVPAGPAPLDADRPSPVQNLAPEKRIPIVDALGLTK